MGRTTTKKLTPFGVILKERGISSTTLANVFNSNLEFINQQKFNKNATRASSFRWTKRKANKVSELMYMNLTKIGTERAAKAYCIAIRLCFRQFVPQSLDMANDKYPDIRRSGLVFWEELIDNFRESRYCPKNFKERGGFVYWTRDWENSDNKELVIGNIDFDPTKWNVGCRFEGIGTDKNGRCKKCFFFSKYRQIDDFGNEELEYTIRYRDDLKDKLYITVEADRKANPLSYQEETYPFPKNQHEFKEIIDNIV